MVIFIKNDGSWLYDWEFSHKAGKDMGQWKRIDIDRLYDYGPLTDMQKKAIVEALDG